MITNASWEIINEVRLLLHSTVIDSQSESNPWLDSLILIVMDLTLAGAWQHVFGPLPADLEERRGVTADESEEQRFAEGVKLGLRRAEEALQPRKTRSSTSGIDI